MEIDDLYDMLPDFICTPGCIECCRNFGVPSRTPVEDERIKKFLAENNMEQPRARGTTCPYVTEEGCSIYPVRPLICRVYGTSENYKCVMGVVPLNYLDPDEEEYIFHTYRTRFL